MYKLCPTISICIIFVKFCSTTTGLIGVNSVAINKSLEPNNRLLKFTIIFPVVGKKLTSLNGITLNKTNTDKIK